MTSDPIVQIRNLSKHFGDIEAVNNISLDVQPREVIVIIGPSGSGKSTLLRCVNRLEVPNSGTIIIDVRHHELRGGKNRGVGVTHSNAPANGLDCREVILTVTDHHHVDGVHAQLGGHLTHASRL